jgi:hypothetical protein
MTSIAPCHSYLVLMRKGRFIPSLLLLMLAGAGCTPVDRSADLPGPLTATIVGRWRYDSVRSWSYYRQGEREGPTTQIMRPGAVLTIGPTSWRYTGSVREDHAYQSRGSRLIVRRLVDSAVVRAHQAGWQDLGQVFGYPHPFFITTLTANRFVICDSANAFDGFMQVSRYYYSR